MENNTYHIDLQDFRTQGSKVFTTRPRGVEVRNKCQIDSVEPNYEKIIITIPPDISSINPSFLEEFFENIVTKLGETAFYNKFSFVNEGRYKIDTDLAEAIERILREENALA
ncbi:MAG TPA: DUF4325 domain-containing protein [Bacteroidia bacterium]|jgi:hypothetical protein